MAVGATLMAKLYHKPPLPSRAGRLYPCILSERPDVLHLSGAPRPSVGAGPGPAHNWVAGGFGKLAGSERNCVFPLRLPSVYQNESEKHWGARDCGFWGAEPCANVYQKSTMRTSAAQTSGFFAALEVFFNLFQPVTGVVQPCHPVSGNVFLLLPENIG